MKVGRYHQLHRSCVQRARTWCTQILHVSTHASTHTLAYSFAHTHSLSLSHVCLHAHCHTLACTHTHTHTHAHTHTRTHTYKAAQTSRNCLQAGISDSGAGNKGGSPSDQSPHQHSATQKRYTVFLPSGPLSTLKSTAFDVLDTMHGVLELDDLVTNVA